MNITYPDRGVRGVKLYFVPLIYTFIPFSLYLSLSLVHFPPPSIPFLPCPLSPLPNPRKNQRIIYGNIKEVICMMNGMAFMFLSLSFPSPPYNSLTVSLPLALCSFLSPHSQPSRYVGALTCFRRKLTHLLCP